MFPLSLLVPDRHSPRVKASRLTTGLTQVHRTHPLLSDLAGGCVLAQVASENSRPQPQPQRTTTTPVQQVQQEASALQPARPEPLTTTPTLVSHTSQLDRSSSQRPHWLPAWV